MSAGVYAVLGLAAGVVQALWLRRSVRIGQSGLAALSRLALVASLLVLAALGGHLFAGAAGWGIGLCVCGGVLAWRWS